MIRIVGSPSYARWIQLPEHFAVFSFSCKHWIPKANGKTIVPINITNEISKGILVVVFSRYIRELVVEIESDRGWIAQFKIIDWLSFSSFFLPVRKWTVVKIVFDFSRMEVLVEVSHSSLYMKLPKRSCGLFHHHRILRDRGTNRITKKHYTPGMYMLT